MLFERQVFTIGLGQLVGRHFERFGAVGMAGGGLLQLLRAGFFLRLQRQQAGLQRAGVRGLLRQLLLVLMLSHLKRQAARVSLIGEIGAARKHLLAFGIKSEAGLLCLGLRALSR